MQGEEKNGQNVEQQAQNEKKPKAIGIWPSLFTLGVNDSGHVIYSRSIKERTTYSTDDWDSSGYRGYNVAWL